MLTTLHFLIAYFNKVARTYSFQMLLSQTDLLFITKSSTWIMFQCINSYIYLILNLKQSFTFIKSQFHFLDWKLIQQFINFGLISFEFPPSWLYEFFLSVTKREHETLWAMWYRKAHSSPQNQEELFPQLSINDFQIQFL